MFKMCLVLRLRHMDSFLDESWKNKGTGDCSTLTPKASPKRLGISPPHVKPGVKVFPVVRVFPATFSWTTLDPHNGREAKFLITACG
jgi:hypothetical protein